MKLKSSKFDDLLSPIINIILGILIIIFKAEVIRWASLEFGILLLCVGIMQLVLELKNNSEQQIFKNILYIIIGVLIIVFAGAFATAIRIIVGILYIVYGAFKLLRVVEMLPTLIRTFVLIEGIMYIVVGILLFLNKDVLYYIIGGLLIFNSIVDVIYILRNGKDIKPINDHKDAIDVEVNEK